MKEFWYGLTHERYDEKGYVLHLLRDEDKLLGSAIEQPDGIASITIVVEGGNPIKPHGEFLMVDDALMAIKTYHDVRRVIDKSLGT